MSGDDGDLGDRPSPLPLPRSPFLKDLRVSSPLIPSGLYCKERSYRIPPHAIPIWRGFERLGVGFSG
jgi:hypothetical protein